MKRFAPGGPEMYTLGRRRKEERGVREELRMVGIRGETRTLRMYAQ